MDDRRQDDQRGSPCDEEVRPRDDWRKVAYCISDIVSIKLNSLYGRQKVLYGQHAREENFERRQKISGKIDETRASIRVCEDLLGTIRLEICKSDAHDTSAESLAKNSDGGS